MIRQWAAFWGLIVVLAACQAAPEDVALSGIRGLCSLQSQRIPQEFTRDSQKILKGIAVVSPEVFQCANPDALTVQQHGFSDGTDGGVYQVTLSDGSRTTRLALVRESGRWKIDLIDTLQFTNIWSSFKALQGADHDVP
jgi:hypothetical protein